MQVSSNGGSEKTDGTRSPKDRDFIESVFELTADDVEQKKTKKPRLLGITCSRSDCDKDLHCFNSSSTKLKYAPGRCQSCGVDLINWDAVRIRDLRDVDRKFEFFQKEWIRHFFFHVPVTQRIEAYARKHGIKGLTQKLESQLKKGQMLRFMPALDWKQTKMLDGTIVHWARHATASCCRACMGYWHNIPLEKKLTEEDIEYFKGLAMRFIELRIPNL